MAWFGHALVAGFEQAALFFWDSLFGLIFGFLVSAIVQVMLTPATMHRYLGPGIKGLLYGAGFGIISSACSYGAAAAARGFYRNGADIRSVLSFLVASTNMNLAILILFWSLLGWRFAFAEFFGGIIIIAVVTIGLTAFFRDGELAKAQREYLSESDGAEGHNACAHHGGEAEVRRGWDAVGATARLRTCACCARNSSLDTSSRVSPRRSSRPDGWPARSTPGDRFHSLDTCCCSSSDS